MLIPQVVVGCFETLSHDEHGWGAWLNWAQERGLVAGKASKQTVDKRMQTTHFPSVPFRSFELLMSFECDFIRPRWETID